MRRTAGREFSKAAGPAGGEGSTSATIPLAMSLKMLIESDPHQTRIAVLEDDRLTEIFVERHRHRGLVGNVYKGRVTRVLPGMQAAFVDVGLERDAFLYVSDVAADVEAMEDLEIDDGRARRRSTQPAAARRRRSTTC